MYIYIYIVMMLRIKKMRNEALLDVTEMIVGSHGNNPEMTIYFTLRQSRNDNLFYPPVNFYIGKSQLFTGNFSMTVNFQ